MFRNNQAFSSFSVDDLQKAKAFYGETLGMEITAEEMEGMPEKYWPLSLRSGGGSRVLIYPKPDHVPAVFTILNFPVPDIEDAVDDLARRGVRFEQYEGEIRTDAKGIHRGPGPLIAWFKDPAGNVLSVIQEN